MPYLIFALVTVVAGYVMTKIEFDYYVEPKE